ncbi:hypothetical protein SAMN04487996_104413 [Dyadobacter soli]|uniref:Uncharacterized protein n=1 Tax=Dyadobacter soli TaxID=659014 RepID=A0A1G7C6A6_9BACT|nr:hypothetical protein [Dyadobacter soli]SDE34827.1 hypothetical protein SAMN04487996_104413 [Dyadobacter soli]
MSTNIGLKNFGKDTKVFFEQSNKKMDLLNGKCNFTNSCNELLRTANRCKSAPFRHVGMLMQDFEPEQVHKNTSA